MTSFGRVVFFTLSAVLLSLLLLWMITIPADIVAVSSVLIGSLIFQGIIGVGIWKPRASGQYSEGDTASMSH